MQPSRTLARRIPMKRTLAVLAVLAVPLPLVAACGSDGGEQTASDPTSQEPTEPTEPPAAPPTVGTYPDFAPEDYTFELATTCFCLDAGAPMRLTVVDDEVTEAVYTRAGRGLPDGTPVPRARWMTIDEVIAAANDTDAEKVEVDWPAGQDYPSSVSVDTSTRIADEEVAYAVSDVVVG
jgi:hypothetical protein